MPPSPTSRRAAAARSLADDIRSRTDEQLTTLLRRRPDLARPAPSDLTSLAARAATRASVQRAVDGLDRAHLRVLQAFVAGGGGRVAVAEAAAALHAPADQVSAVLDHLRELALVWDAADGPHVVRTAADLLGRSAVAAPETATATAAATSAPTVAPTAAPTVRDQADVEPAAEPQHGLEPPPLAIEQRSQQAVDDAGGAAASELLGLVEELAQWWGARPPRVLRSGGLAVRDLRRVAVHLDIDVDHAAFVVETGYVSGLLADDAAAEPCWAPTPAYDDWREGTPAGRWAHLAASWLGSPRASHRVGTAPPDVNGTINALSPAVLSSPSRQVRLEVLAELALLPAGAAPSADTLVARLSWRRPLRARDLLDTASRATLREAERLGVTGRGALTTAGRALVTGAPADEVAAVVAPAMPVAVDHVVIQADLTAVAPGRLEGELSALMRLVADVESRGGATVYRLSAESVRRAMDAGWSADQLLSALRAASATPLPQPLEYLVGDVARRHGATRVGAVTSYVRSDDPAAMDTMVGERALAPLQLRRIAPTVIVSPSSATVLLDLLRENGFAPVAEGADGGVRVPRQKEHRASTRRAPAPVSVSVVDELSAASLVRSLRAAEEAATTLRRQEQDRPGPRLPTTDPTVALAMLRDSVAASRPLWIGYSDSEGGVTRHLFWPRRVEGGRAFGHIDGADGESAFSIHRITGASSG